MFSDRYGRERIFLHNSGTRVFFASEAKAILAVAPRTRTFDPTGLAELLACGCTLGTQSLFCGIEILEGGTVLTLDGTRMSRRRYFDPATLEHLAPVSANDFLEGFSDAFRSAVNVHARSTPRVGISLTGGLDSRMVMACLTPLRAACPATRSEACIGQRAMLLLAEWLPHGAVSRITCSNLGRVFSVAFEKVSSRPYTFRTDISGFPVPRSSMSIGRPARWPLPG